MLQMCVFGGYDGQLGQETKTYFTLFGGCDLKRPTLARELLAMLRARSEVPSPGYGENNTLPTTPRPRSGRKVVITIFGATEITYPTLAEEFIDLREACHSGQLDINAWDSYMAELAQWQQQNIISFTLFAGFDETNLPSEEAEVESLALQRYLGGISEAAGHMLEMGVGQTGSQRRAVVHQAILAT